MILITGASGSVGKAVLQEVSRKESTSHAKFRAMFRSKEEAAKAPAGSEPVLADYADKQSLRKALAGVTSVFVVCSPIPQLVELESNVLDVCKESGVKHVVLNSALGAGDYPKSFPSWHRKVEDKLKATGMSYTILRPNGFLQNIVAFNAPSIELNGPEAISNQELATRISAVAGRTVNYVDIPESAQRDAMLGLGLPDWQVTALLELQQYYKQGAGAKTDGLLRDLIERDPMTLDQYLTANAREFRDQAASA